MSFQSLLIHRCTITKPVTYTDPYYYVVQEEVGEDISCRLVAIDATLIRTVLGRTPRGTHILYLQGNQEIDQNYVVTLDHITGREFRVVEDLPAYTTSSVPHHKECLVEEKTQM